MADGENEFVLWPRLWSLPWAEGAGEAMMLAGTQSKAAVIVERSFWGRNQLNVLIGAGGVGATARMAVMELWHSKAVVPVVSWPDRARRGGETKRMSGRSGVEVGRLPGDGFTRQLPGRGGDSAQNYVFC